jgi:1-aminocyclopropane-1-carboxylate deaminase/D-cysteine desulfhydrase-like pyridoxal-dependent ACC family enzyme
MSEQQVDLFGEPVVQDAILRDKFMEPPFSVLDSKGGAWQNRKRQWKGVGIESHIGRGDKLLGGGAGNSKEQDEDFSRRYGRKVQNGVGIFDSATSIFDPALCELVYRWYCPAGGTVLDPFAGGSVRGIVANYLGYNYTGIDIRQEQVDSNIAQALKILPLNRQPLYLVGDSNMVLEQLINKLTPVQQHGEYYLKRDDLFFLAGVNGGKVRSCYNLMRGARGVVTAGSRKSPQINIVASIAQLMNIPFYAHTPNGELGEELLLAQSKGANIIQHPAGYNSVIKARAREHAIELGLLEVPFGMMCDTAVEETRRQAQNLPANIKRIVIPVGSGMSLAGLLHGLHDIGLTVPVLGVVVGADPTDTLDAFAPMGWRGMVKLVPAGVDHHEEVEVVFGGVVLDPIYEAKCVRFLEPGDLFWVIGLRESIAQKCNQNGINFSDYDLLFSCPPYADLEVYSELPGDISNMEYGQFIEVYRAIISKSCKLLKRGGYAAFVVGDIRDKHGYYRDFVSHTKRAFIDAGVGLYNEAILLQPLGTAMLRAAKIFEAGGKLTKVHEHLLIFKKP